MNSEKRDDVPDYLPPWPDWSKLPTNAEKTPPRRRRTGVVAAVAVTSLALLLLWQADPLVVLPFLWGLIPFLRRRNTDNRNTDN